MVKYRRKKGHRKAHPVRDPLDRWGDDIETSTTKWGKYTEKAGKDFGDWWGKEEKHWTKGASKSIDEGPLGKPRKARKKKKLDELDRPL